MRVKVRYFTTLRELTQHAEGEIELEDNGLLRDFDRKKLRRSRGMKHIDIYMAMGTKRQLTPQFAS